MLGKKLGIDLGTTTTRVVVRGEGIVAEEPSVVAAVGDGALVGSDAVTADSELRWVLDRGSIADPTGLRALFHQLVNRAVGRQRIFKPDIVIAVRSDLAGEHRRQLLDLASGNGARTSYLLDAGIAAAMGSGVPISGRNAHLVVDLGGGKTEIAALALEGTVTARCVLRGGSDLVAAIGIALQRRGISSDAGEIVGLLESVARLGEHEERRGRVGEGEVSSYDLAPIIEEHLQPVVDGIREVLDELPVTLREDVRREGMVISGGAARIEGIDRHLTAASGISARTIPDPQLSTVRGTALALDNLDVLKRNLMYIR